MLLVITGNGKGKTTSAIGTAIRSIGWGKKTALVFFDKGGSHYGEQHILDLLQEKITVQRFGQQRFNEKSQKFRFRNTKKDIEEVSKALLKTEELFEQDYFLIICDELVSCLSFSLTDEKSVQHLIDRCPEKTNLLLTGRNAPKWLIEKADLVSEVNEVKHYYRKLKKAVKGIDY